VRSLAIDLLRLLATAPGWIFMVLGSLVWGVLVIPLTLLLARVWPGVRELFNDLTHRVLHWYILALPFVRFQVEGREHRLRGPRILVVNHQSWLDPLLMIGLEPRLGGPVRRYMVRVPIFGSILRLAGFYQSDIGELPSLEQMRLAAERARARGGGLLFFPEGTRSADGEIGPFHRGAFRTAVDYSLPIQPVVIEGLDRVLPRGNVLAETRWRYPVRIRYLDPILPPFGGGVRREVVRSLTERVRGQFVDELARLRSKRGALTRIAS
jgi:1-acyl-sn-glycerol-3-phosphate acyltransferase